MLKKSLFTLLLIASVSLMNGCDTSSAPEDYTGVEPFVPVQRLESAAYYKSNGEFDQARAKQAYYDMMRAFHYPISEMLKSDDFWTADFIQGDFARLGMAGIFWKNVSGTYGQVGAKKYAGEFKDANYGYLGHNIYLLPGQMLPEHNHLGNGEKKGYGPKMETWHVTHGTVEFFGEYNGGGETPISDLPENERPWGYGEKWFKSKYVAKLDAGGIYSLNDPESFHFMRAGKHGAIVSEFATYHNDVQFSNPDMEFGNSSAEKITKIKK